MRFALLAVLLACAGQPEAPTPDAAPADPAPPEPAADEPAAAAIVATVEGGSAELSARVPMKAGEVTFAEAEVVNSGDTWYLERRTSEGEDCVTERISLAAREGGLAIVPGVSVTESCAGQNCSACEFKDSGGCACVEPVAGDGPSLCNHTITSGEGYEGMIEALGPR